MYERRETERFIYFGNRVSICKPETDPESYWQHPTISWSVIGSVHVNEAKAFHEALGLAIKEAEKLNEELCK